MIIAHIDHGKSTLADRMLEITETVRTGTKPNIWTRWSLKERGIHQDDASENDLFSAAKIRIELNRYSRTDFGYEVSRALPPLGAVLLVDAIQNADDCELRGGEKGRFKNNRLRY